MAGELPKKAGSIDVATAKALNLVLGVAVNVKHFGAKGDGVTDDSVAIQAAIDSIATGTILFPPATYICKGIVPKNNVTLMGYGATLKLPVTTTTDLIKYNSNTRLFNFNLIGLRFDANTLITYDLVCITQPNPVSPTKTWYMSTVRDCHFTKGKRGIYCPVPGSVKIESCYFLQQDIGMEWDQEHFYILNTVYWQCRIGIQSIDGNHFTCVNGVFAHCEEYGVNWSGFESVFSACSFIDNIKAGIYGDFYSSRIEGCRFLTCQKGIHTLGTRNMIIGNQIYDGNQARDIVDDAEVVGIQSGAGYNIISNNTIGNFENSIKLTHSLSYDTIITSNQIASSKGHSILVTGNLMGCVITGNELTDNGIAPLNTFSGIRITGTITASLINSNVIRNTGAGSMKYGIEISAGTMSDVLISNNISRAMKTSGYSIPATITQVNNIGTVVNP